MAVNLISQADIELRMGAQSFRELTDDDKDGVADPGLVAQILDEASRIGEGLLWDGFPDVTQIAQLAGADAAVKGAIADIACGLAGARKPALVGPDGKPCQYWRRQQGEKVLAQIAKSERRAGGEASVGTNALLRSRVSRARPPTFTFASTKQDPKGPGGF